MTLLQKLQAHRGSLIRLKTQLYWYDGRGYDGSPGRVCLLLDASDDVPAGLAARTDSDSGGDADEPFASAALLLVDGSPQWAWVVDGDVEIIHEVR